MEMKEFDDDDWFKWAGAEEFSENSPPLIGVSENGLVVVADKNGIEILSDVDSWQLNIRNQIGVTVTYVTQAVIEAVLNALPDNITEAVLDEYGFVSEDEDVEGFEDSEEEE